MAGQNKTRPTEVPVEDFLAGIEERRAAEARELVPVFEEITGEKAVMWGPSIIGFGTHTYSTTKGEEIIPLLGFSPRKANLTIYFQEGFEPYTEELAALGRHKTSKACLYITRLANVDMGVLRTMIEKSWERWS